MFQAMHPKIHLSEVIDYDIKKKEYMLKDLLIFDNEEELVYFLAINTSYALDFSRWPCILLSKKNNPYMDNQALIGIERTTENSSSVHNKNVWINDEWRLPKYLFWIDSTDRPNFDVRILQKKVDKGFHNSSMIPKSVKSKKKTQTKQSKKRHACWTYRKDARYIQRAKIAYGLAAEDEYKQFSKAKDRAFASCWPDEDFSGRRSSGWKDNPGNKYMHQWAGNSLN